MHRKERSDSVDSNDSKDDFKIRYTSPMNIESIDLDRRNSRVLDETDLAKISQKILSSKISYKIPKLNLNVVEKKNDNETNISGDSWTLLDSSHK